jgi:hypothetical protein
MTNPVLSALLDHKVRDIVADPPRWNADMKKVFVQLPHHLQIYLAAREKERDREVRRNQNERAEAVKKLEVVEAKLAAAEDRLERAETRLKELTNVENQADTIA